MQFLLQPLSYAISLDNQNFVGDYPNPYKMIRRSSIQIQPQPNLSQALNVSKQTYFYFNVNCLLFNFFYIIFIMNKFIISFLLAIYYQHSVYRFSLGNLILSKDIKADLQIFTPKEAGSYTPMLFFTGLGGVVPSMFYSHFCTEIASNGVIFIAVIYTNQVSKLQLLQPMQQKNSLQYVIDWIFANMQSEFDKRLQNVHLNLEQFGISGHSAAGHPLFLYLNESCGNVKWTILFSPVDGQDPWGFVKNFITNPPNKLPFELPVLIAMVQLDNVPLNRLYPACAGNKTSNQRFYQSLNGPTWLVNTTKYGHADFLNQDVRHMASFICSECRKQCNFKLYTQHTVNLTINFIRGIIQQNQTAIDYIQNSKSFAIEAITKHDYHDYPKLTGPFCKHSKKLQRQ